MAGFYGNSSGVDQFGNIIGAGVQPVAAQPVASSMGGFTGLNSIYGGMSQENLRFLNSQNPGLIPSHILQAAGIGPAPNIYHPQASAAMGPGANERSGGQAAWPWQRVAAPQQIIPQPQQGPPRMFGQGGRRDLNDGRHDRIDQNRLDARRPGQR